MRMVDNPGAEPLPKPNSSSRPRRTTRSSDARQIDIPSHRPARPRIDAGGTMSAAARAASISLDTQHLKSCFRSGRPSLASFDLDWFRTICLAARNLDHVHLILRMLHDGLGASACALVNIGPTRYSPIFELLVGVPGSLRKAIKARRVVDDPMMVACEQRVLGFAASDLERVIEMNDRRRATLALYEAHGLRDGFTVPLCVPGEPRGFCSFGFADPDDLTLDVMGVINLASAMLFETARRVSGMWLEHRLPSELTQRQVDCVAGVARGLNDNQIAWQLGIGVQTVHDHLDAARKRYGAHKRADLAVQAIRAGDLHWNRIVGDPLLGP